MKDNIIYNREEDSIDIIAIVKNIWDRKMLLLNVTIISFIIGVVVALISPVIYESQTTFIPQTSDHNSSSAKGLGSLASLAGINLNAEISSSLDNYISPLLYSQIIESEEFSMTLINEELINLEGELTTIKNYILSQSKFSIIGFIKKNSIGLFKNDKNTKEGPSSNLLRNYNFISSEDYMVMNNFRRKFFIELEPKEGYIKVLAYDKNAFISAQIVKLVTKNLQSRIISLRTNKIKEQLDWSEKQYKQKQKEFEILQNTLAQFKDSNKNISTAVFLSELQKLESEYQLQQNILMSLASEYNNNKIKLNKDTPIFSVLDEVSVPNERHKPKRTLIVMIFVIVSIFTSILYILIADLFHKSFKS